VVGYTVLGGLLSDVVTDLFQGAVVVIGLVLLLGFAFAAAGGVGAALSSISPDQLHLVDDDESLLAAMDSWMVPIVGSLVAQEAISRFLGAKSASVARNACFAAAGLYLTVGLIPVIVGLIAANLDLKLVFDDTFLPMLAEELMPPVLFVIFIGAVISAILSTVDSTLLAVSALMTRNIIDPLTPRASDRQRLAIARLIVVISGVIAYVIATGSDSIYGLVETASSYGTAGIAVTVVIGLWSGFGGPRAALAALIAGLAGTVIFGAYYEDVSFILSLIVSAIAFVAVAALERREPVAAG
jgi:Na+/proline symporter